VAVGPHWPRLRNFLQAERAHQIQYLATAGIDRFLAALCPPLIQWHPPVLEVQGRGGPRDIDLGGRGLVIVPSVFLGAEVRVTSDACDADTPRLSYPVVRDIHAARQLWTGSRDEQALAALLGRTRSAALEAIAQGCGTAELAVRVGISPPQPASMRQCSGDPA
jgi:hypothetical protein